MEAREIFIKIKQKIRFQQEEKEADSHYTILGNSLVRISNHCTYMNTWENYLIKHPQCQRMNIISIVFEDGGDTFTPECLFVDGKLNRTIKASEFIYKSASLTNEEILSIRTELQQMDTTNAFKDVVRRAKTYTRISFVPDYNNVEVTPDGHSIPAGFNGLDYPIEESKTRKYMKQNKKTINEAQLRAIVSEVVKSVLKENGEVQQSLISQARKTIQSALGNCGFELCEEYTDESGNLIEGYENESRVDIDIKYTYNNTYVD